jgi:hypothetical protein
MMDVCVSVVTRQNTTSNERARENVRKGGKQSSHQHKSSSIQTSLKTQRERDDDVDKYNCCYDEEKKKTG